MYQAMAKKPSKRAPLQANDVRKKTKNKGGRPTVMTAAVQLVICSRIAGGESLTTVCRDPTLPNRGTVTKFAAGDGPDNQQFATRYAQARESLLDVYADQMIDISDDGTTDYITKVGRNGHEYEAVDQEHIQRSRLRVDTRKWLLSKLRPGQYGDRVTAEVSGSVGVTHDISSLSERERMRRFALFMVEDQRQPAVDGEAVRVDQPVNESSNSTAVTLQADEELKQ